MPTELEIRQQLLTEISSLSTDKLKKLATIGSSILTPMDTELTSVDFATMIDQVFKSGGLADLYFPTWTDKSSSDFGRFLVELFAMFSDKDMFYINHYSKEAFLGVAEEYRSVFHKALNQGFNPPSNVSATGDIELTFTSGSAEVIPRGSIVIGVAEFPDLVYSNLAFTLPLSSIETGVTAPFIHGKLRTDTGEFDGYSILIDTKNIVDGSIELFIDGSSWYQVNNFLGGNESTQHFMVVFNNNGKAEILFASGGLGSIPEVGSNFLVKYLVGGGYIGDIQEGVLNLIVKSETIRVLLGFSQFEMAGGNDRLPLERLRSTVIGKQRHQNRVVTPEDVQYFCEELSFIRKVHAETFGNFVYIFALPIGGGELSPSQITAIKQKINSPNQDDKKLMMGFNLKVSSAVFTPLKISANIYLLPSTIRSSAYIKADQILKEILDPLKEGDFGDGFNRSTISAKLLQRISGSTNVIFTELHRLGTPMAPNDINFIGREMVDLENSVITINLIGGI